jgi:DNA-binding CsgD family transcriptional regulator
VPDTTRINPVVVLCNWQGKLVWTSSPNPVYEPGPDLWDYICNEDREKVKQVLSRAVIAREAQEYEATSSIGEHYRAWIWPLNTPEVAVCILAIRVPNELRLLTTREKECLHLLADGRTTQEIALALDVSVSTIHTHFKRSREKLGLPSVEALIGFAARYCYSPSAPPGTFHNRLADSA